jgi:hypothetical protein
MSDKDVSIDNLELTYVELFDDVKYDRPVNVYDKAMDHFLADEMLLKFMERAGHKNVADAYRRQRERIGFIYSKGAE